MEAQRRLRASRVIAMTRPPAARPSTKNRVRPAQMVEVCHIEVRDSNGQLVRKVHEYQANAILAQGLGDWSTAANGRKYVKLKTINAPGRRAGDWMHPTSVVRERLQRNAAGRELTTMFRFVDP
jgi:G:T/U-mismatch repair DNA glycosylase